MEIEFNSNRSIGPEENESANRPKAADLVLETTFFDSAQHQERSRRNFPPVRPAQVERARALLSDSTYPPDELQNRIADLLALHLK